MIVVQLLIYCAVFTLIVKYAVRNGAIDGLYFYPKTVQDRAVEIGLISREEMDHKRKIFMTEFFLIMLIVLTVIIGVFRKAADFKTAYLTALLFLEVMNWYDGIVIDKIWVGCSKFWLLPGCEDLPYVQTWPQVFRKRIILTFIWVAGAAVVAGIVVLLF